MYENLIETLRFCAKDGDCHNCPYEKPCAGTFGDGLYCEAAEAIKELSKQLDDMNEANIALYGALPHWIPVSERLPEHGWYLAYGTTIKMEVLHFHSVEEVWSSERYYNIEVTH